VSTAHRGIRGIGSFKPSAARSADHRYPAESSSVGNATATGVPRLRSVSVPPPDRARCAPRHRRADSEEVAPATLTPGIRVPAVRHPRSAPAGLPARRSPRMFSQERDTRGNECGAKFSFTSKSPWAGAPFAEADVARGPPPLSISAPGRSLPPWGSAADGARTDHEPRGGFRSCPAFGARHSRIGARGEGREHQAHSAVKPQASAAAKFDREAERSRRFERCRHVNSRHLGDLMPRGQMISAGFARTLSSERACAKHGPIY